ncbi:hypothetical protein Hdeb2414_s0011g00362001 [Helianthus debilis subsp. tardiflorus]
MATIPSMREKGNRRRRERERERRRSSDPVSDERGGGGVWTMTVKVGVRRSSDPVSDDNKFQNLVVECACFGPDSSMVRVFVRVNCGLGFGSEGAGLVQPGLEASGRRLSQTGSDSELFGSSIGSVSVRVLLFGSELLLR